MSAFHLSLLSIPAVCYIPVGIPGSLHLCSSVPALVAKLTLFLPYLYSVARLPELVTFASLVLLTPTIISCLRPGCSCCSTHSYFFPSCVTWLMIPVTCVHLSISTTFRRDDVHIASCIFPVSSFLYGPSCILCSVLLLLTLLAPVLCYAPSRGLCSSCSPLCPSIS